MEERTEELIFCKEASVDNCTFYLFRTTNGEHRLVDASSYKAFNLKSGMTVSARMRKKGCAGEEITELNHPVYAQGKEYFFHIVKTGSLPFNNETIHFVVVGDGTGKEYRIRVEEGAPCQVGQLVKCRLEDQTDGRLRFTVVSFE